MGFCPSGLIPDHPRRRRSRRCLSLMTFFAAAPLSTEALASLLRRVSRALDGSTVSARFRFPFVGGSRPSWTLFWNLARAPPPRQAVAANVRPVGPNHVPDCKRATTFDRKVLPRSQGFKTWFPAPRGWGGSPVIPGRCADRWFDNLNRRSQARTLSRSNGVRGCVLGRRSCHGGRPAEKFTATR